MKISSFVIETGWIGSKMKWKRPISTNLKGIGIILKWIGSKSNWIRLNSRWIGLKLKREKLEINRVEFEVNRKKFEVNRIGFELNRVEFERNRVELEINRMNPKWIELNYWNESVYRRSEIINFNSNSRWMESNLKWIGKSRSKSG